MVGIPEDMYAMTHRNALRDKKSLAAMGVADAHIKGFQIQPSLTLPAATASCWLWKPCPRPRAAAKSSNWPMRAPLRGGDFLIGALAILAEQQTSGAADYIALKVLGRLPGATSASGELQVPAPVGSRDMDRRSGRFCPTRRLGAAPRCSCIPAPVPPASRR